MYIREPQGIVGVLIGGAFSAACLANPINGSPITDRELNEIEAGIEERPSLVLADKNKNHFRQPINYHHPAYREAATVQSQPDTKSLNAELTAGLTSYNFTSFKNNASFTKTLNLRKYNGQLVGDTWVVKPGDTLKIHLNNQLPPETHPACDDTGACDHNRPHNFNTTNIHTHGLHVDPSGNSDNVFIRVAPGKSFDYEIKIPENHVAGTFWYHAHVHGASSVQVGSGMSGALIVQGDYDRIPALAAARQKIMMLQEIAFDDRGTIENNDTYAPTAWQDSARAMGWHISINGLVMPEIKLHPGEVELWRFIHGGVRKNVKLALINPCTAKRIPLVQIASDGIASPSKRLTRDSSVFMAPGYRSDVVLKAMKRGVYYLIDEADESVNLGPQYCHRRPENRHFALDEQAQNILARVVVKGHPVAMQFPSNRDLASIKRPRPIEDEELSPVVEYLQFDIDVSKNPWVGLINGSPYDPDHPRILKLDTAQTWEISSVFSHHPYHIHVNPFEVIFRDEEGKIKDRIWKDTILVDELNSSQTNKIETRTRYEDFTGAFVTHCHILDHEDHGMMEKIVIEH